ncbi:MAG TPA: hypothetical protein VHO72_04145 [Bacteroidales bacterium]|nr:hypothetical protein [Bacteroidales bacterium]
MKTIKVLNRPWGYEIKEGNLFLYEYNHKEKKFCNYDIIRFETTGNTIKDELFIVNIIKKQRF